MTRSRPTPSPARASDFVHKKKSVRIYTSMHSGEVELTKLTYKYNGHEDNLPGHRGDEAANSLSAATGPELSITRNPLANTFRSGHGRTRLGSGLRAVAPRCLSRENAGRTMTVLHHALCGDDFQQTPVSILYMGEMFKDFFGFVGDATQVLESLIHPPSPGFGVTLISTE